MAKTAVQGLEKAAVNQLTQLDKAVNSVEDQMRAEVQGLKDRIEAIADGSFLFQVLAEELDFETDVEVFDEPEITGTISGSDWDRTRALAAGK